LCKHQPVRLDREKQTPEEEEKKISSRDEKNASESTQRRFPIEKKPKGRRKARER